MDAACVQQAVSEGKTLRAVVIAADEQYRNAAFCKRNEKPVKQRAAFRRANDLAMAMEARCYHGGEGRTKMKPLKYCRKDRIAYITVIAYVVLVVLIGRFVPLHIWIF